MIYAVARHELAMSKVPKVRVRDRAPPLPAPTLDQLFAALATARRRLLVLDYDGTLAPFDANRMAARPYPGVHDLLSRIRQQPSTRVVFLSGRPAREMHDLLMLSPPPEIWGVHRWERMMASGQLLRSILPTQARGELNRLMALQPQVEALGATPEQKYGSVALHWRGLSPDRARQPRALLQPFQDSARARVDAAYSYLKEFDGGSELRARGPNKRSVVRALLREEARNAAIACLGDEVSDEEAFVALGGRCLAVRLMPPQASETARAPPRRRQACKCPPTCSPFSDAGTTRRIARTAV